eukprot:755257-Hanusia_phi.AAC.1
MSRRGKRKQEEETGLPDGTTEAPARQEKEPTVFEEYYRMQQLLGEDERTWAIFVRCLYTPLPVTLRINRNLHSKDL